MPPKPDKKKKKKDEEKVKKEEDPSKRQLQFFQLHVTQLHGNLQRSMQVQHQAAEQQKEAQEAAAVLQHDLEDVVALHKREFSNRQDEVSRLKEAALATETALRRRISDLEQQLDAHQKRSKQQIELYEQDIRVRDLKLAQLDVIQNSHESTEQQYEDLQLQLAEAQAAHTATVADLNRQKVADRALLTKTMITKLNEASSAFQEEASVQLSDTTKRAIRENVQLSNEISALSSTTQLLIQQTQSLSVNAKQHKLESDITAGLEHDLALQNHKLQKLIGRLTERVRSLECQLQVAQSESRQQTPIPQPSHQPHVATEHLRQLDAAQAEIATLKESVFELKANGGAAMRTIATLTRRHDAAKLVVDMELDRVELLREDFAAYLESLSAEHSALKILIQQGLSQHLQGLHAIHRELSEESSTNISAECSPSSPRLLKQRPSSSPARFRTPLTLKASSSSDEAGTLSQQQHMYPPLSPPSTHQPIQHPLLPSSNSADRVRPKSAYVAPGSRVYLTELGSSRPSSAMTRSTVSLSSSRPSSGLARSSTALTSRPNSAMARTFSSSHEPQGPAPPSLTIRHVPTQTSAWG